MYVVTFYSYKGGVGRTMALVNIAALLAQAGKRVLAVDFDLEAPGLSSYEPFRCAGTHNGLVEYVTDYLETGRAPIAADYIVEKSVGNGASVWLMPAGRHTDPGYAAKFSAINWQSLYADHEGFLLFEDLKQQWAEFDDQGFDYVLIDSRTGHTDIGGICTRQLPDAVVVMYLPTPQNIEGLKPIVRAIRRESAPIRRDRVRLHFCPSNLPDLDDQELILKALLQTAAEELGYVETAAEIYHYGALDLLQQPIYSLTSPNSRLAGQYEDLCTAIISYNLTDRDGALVAIERLETQFEEARRGKSFHDLQSIQSEAALIAGRFPTDVAIAWALADLAETMTRPEDALTALNVIVDSDDANRAVALLKRASARASLDDRKAAVADLRRLLAEETPTAFEVRPAIELLKSLEAEGWRTTLEDALVNDGLDAIARNEILMALLSDRETAGAIVELAKRLNLRRALILASIADGRFEQARDAIISGGAPAVDELPDLFNLAICDWAIERFEPVALFTRVIAKAEAIRRTGDPNGLQCFALAKYVLGRRDEALEDLRLAELAAPRVSSTFSCWRYLTVPASEMSEDLAEMRALIEAGATLMPPGRGGLKATNR